MAIIHRATLVPSKKELLENWLPHQPWAGDGPVEMLGAYRFDDPAGEVGVEGLVVGLAGRLLHIPMTYRGAAVPGLEAHLIGTLEHSVLGRRWAYDGTADPVAVGCFRRALAGQQEQAVHEVWEGDELIEVREPTVRITREVTDDVPAAGDPTIVRQLAESVDPAPRYLMAAWDGGRAVAAHQG